MPVYIIFRAGVAWNAGVDETKVRLIFIEAYDVGHLWTNTPLLIPNDGVVSRHHAFRLYGQIASVLAGVVQKLLQAAQALVVQEIAAPVLEVRQDLPLKYGIVVEHSSWRVHAGTDHQFHALCLKQSREHLRVSHELFVQDWPHAAGRKLLNVLTIAEIPFNLGALPGYEVLHFLNVILYPQRLWISLALVEQFHQGHIVLYRREREFYLVAHRHLLRIDYFSYVFRKGGCCGFVQRPDLIAFTNPLGDLLQLCVGVWLRAEGYQAEG